MNQMILQISATVSSSFGQKQLTLTRTIRTDIETIPKDVDSKGAETPSSARTSTCSWWRLNPRCEVAYGPACADLERH